MGAFAAVVTAMTVSELRAITIVNCDAPVQSRKRGVGVNSLSGPDFTALAPGVSWYYNWGIAPLGTKPAGVAMDYLPMVWNGGGISALGSHFAAGYRPWRVLAMNEPNWIYQANMTPQQCATTYSQAKALADPYGIPVIGPNMMIGTAPSESITAYDPIQGTNVTYTFQNTFLDAFLNYCGANKPPGMATHSYGGSGEMTWITGAMRSAYPTQNVWVTEFNHSGATNDATVLATMISTVDYLERTSWVEGYAWFMARISGDPYNSLLTSTSGALSAAGQAYVQMPVHDPNLYYRIPGKLQAERYVTISNMDISPTTDANGLADMRSTAAAGSASYNIQVDTSGLYSVSFRTSGPTGDIRVYQGATLLGTATAGSTGWATVSAAIALSAGAQTLRVEIGPNSRLLNWAEFTLTAATPPQPANLTGIAGNAQVALNWSASSGATSYNIKRSTTHGGPYSTVGTPATNSFTNGSLTNGTTYYYVVSAVNGSGESANSSQFTAKPQSVVTGYQVNSGGAASGSFAADASFSGGATGVSANTINTSGLVNPAPAAVYQSERYGNFTYTFGGLTAANTYNVRLHFAEVYWTAAGQRRFNVLVNGTQVLTNFDIFVSAGGQNKGVIREFNATATGGGQVTVQYTTVTDNAKSSGIEILPLSGPITVANSGFETPSTATYVTAPSGASWTFSANTGVSANASAFTSGNPSAPQGGQVATLQSTGTVSQSFSGFVTGQPYTLRIAAAQRANWGGAQAYDVLLNGTPIQTVSSLTTSYQDHSTSFTATSATQTISIAGKNFGDNTAFLDNVRITSP